MNLKILLCITVLVSISIPVDSSKILGVFWTPSKSHHILGSALLQALAKKGHNVTLMSSFVDDVNIPNFKQVKLEGIKSLFTTVTNPDISKIQAVRHFISRVSISTEKFWKQEPIRALVESKESYDVIISLNFFNDGILALNHHLGAPTIIFQPAASSSVTNQYVANPNVPYTESMMIDSSKFSGFLQRLITTSAACFMSLLQYYVITPAQEAPTRVYMPNSPPTEELKRNVSLVLVNSHISLETPRPYVPNMVQIGGFYAQTTNKLPDNLQKYLDSAKDGAILFSFGTNMQIKDIDKDKLNAIMEGLRKISPIKVVFKSEIELKDAPNNVLVSNWLPQNDLLAHPNIKAFITHGGLGGNTEAVYHGVPMLGIPLFADQKTNIDNAVKAGYAVRLLYEDITQKTVDEALEKILKDPVYFKNAKKRSSLLRNQPMNPMDKAIWWVEHIIEHKGGEHLRNLGMDLEWYQLYGVDVMLFYLVLILMIITIQLLIFRWFVKKVFCRSSDKKSKKD